MENKSVKQVVAEMRQLGYPEEVISQLKQRVAQQEAQSAPSQQDRVDIQLNDGNAPGVYITSEQVAQDLFANALRHQEALAAGQSPLPNYQMYPDPSMGNPNYTVVATGQRTTADADGNIIHY